MEQQMPHLPQTPREPSKATTVFVLGLLSLLVCSILGPFAVVIGNGERRRVQQGLIPPDGMLTAGWIMGIIGTCLIGVQLLGVAVWLLMFSFIVMRH